MRYILLIILLWYAHRSTAQSISAIQAQSDIIFLKAALINGHPGEQVFLENTVRHLDSLQKSIVDSIPIRNFFREIRYAVTLVNCVHTYAEKINRPLPIIAPNYFPFDIFIQNGELYLVEKLKDSLPSINLPLQIKSINGSSAKDLIKKMQHYRSSDGNLVTTNNSYITEYGYFFVAGFLNYPDTFTISTNKSDEILVVPSIQIKLEADTTVLPPAIFEMEENKFYRLKQDSTIYVLDLDGFANTKYTKYYKKVFNYIEENNITNLIIDLRDNLGGHRYNVAELLGYFLDTTQTYQLTKKSGAAKPYVNGGTYFLQALKFNVGEFYRCKYENGYATFTYKMKPHDKHYEGNLYVLINGKSASASGITAAYLQHYSDATLIGEEAAGGKNGNNGGSYCKLELPESKIQIQFPIFRLTHDFIIDSPYNGVMPQHVITYTVSDIMNNTDKEIEFVLQHKRK